VPVRWQELQRHEKGKSSISRKDKPKRRRTADDVHGNVSPRAGTVASLCVIDHDGMVKEWDMGLLYRVPTVRKHSHNVTVGTLHQGRQPDRVDVIRYSTIPFRPDATVRPRGGTVHVARGRCRKSDSCCKSNCRGTPHLSMLQQVTTLVSLSATLIHHRDERGAACLPKRNLGVKMGSGGEFASSAAPTLDLDARAGERGTSCRHGVGCL
jgi:hypothetical protein